MKIAVISHPGSRQEKIIARSQQELEIWIKKQAVEGKANKKITELLADYYHIPKSHIRLVKGMTSKRKVFELIL